MVDKMRGVDKADHPDGAVHELSLGALLGRFLQCSEISYMILS
jgi:hypothetical protein